MHDAKLLRHLERSAKENMVYVSCSFENTLSRYYQYYKDFELRIALQLDINLLSKV